MYLYSYVITRDYGFAPNPFWNICSLATCKPQIRERALMGDWVAGFGGANTAISHKMVFLMRVDEICTFDEYWEDPRFLVKRPRFDGNYQQCYGDNIYHHIGNEWMQENSHHSYVDGINQNNLLHICANIVDWVGCHYEMGQQGLPYKWNKSGQFVRFEGERK